MFNDVRKGSVTGTGSAINVSCGFRPRKVDLFNLAGLCRISWTDQVGWSAFKTYKHDSGNVALDRASGAVTIYVGTTTEAEGFTIAADSDLNVSGEDIAWTAYR